MPEATAQKKFSCSACGAAAEWNPAMQVRDNPFGIHPHDNAIRPNGIEIIQPSVDAQRLRWLIVQTIHQL